MQVDDSQPRAKVRPRDLRPNVPRPSATHILVNVHGPVGKVAARVQNDGRGVLVERNQRPAERRRRPAPHTRGIQTPCTRLAVDKRNLAVVHDNSRGRGRVKKAPDAHEDDEDDIDVIEIEDTP